jgi:hypothetical protein
MRNSPIIIYSMTERSVCLGNEEEDGEEGEDEEHIQYTSTVPYSLFYERDVCVPGQ